MTLFAYRFRDWFSLPLMAAALVASVSCTLRPSRTIAAPPRFVAILSDGTRAEGSFLADWHAVQSPPRLENQPLFAPNQPLRWLRDRQLTLGDAGESYVELIGGDRLPGRVIGFVEESAQPGNAIPAHLIVEPLCEHRPPPGVAATSFRVVSRFVQRVVWRRSSTSLAGASLELHDGRLVAFRSARFSTGELNVLTDDGLRRFAPEELTQLTFAESDAWESYFDELVVLTPDGSSRLMQVETNDGLIATTSLERFVARTDGNAADFARWVHGIQPAWSLDVIWIPNSRIAMRRSFASHEVPITRFVPRNAGTTDAGSPNASPLAGDGLGGFGALTQRTSGWQVNRTVEGRVLRPSGGDAGWGIGVRSESRLAFPIHPAVRVFRGRFSIDQAVGTGGCVKAMVALADAPSSPLFASGFVLGGNAPIDLGSIAIPPAGDPTARRELLLHVDAAHAGRPAGADPFTIRDMADWIEPMWELDPAAVQTELARRRTWDFAAWSGWTAEPSEIAAARRVSLPDDLVVPATRFQSGIAAGEGAAIRLHPTVIARAARWLVVGGHRVVDSPTPPQIEVRVAGELFHRGDAPWLDRNRRDMPPIVVSLAGVVSSEEKGDSETDRKEDAAPARTTVDPNDIEVRQVGAADSPAVVWRTLQVAEVRPTIQCLFDEESGASHEFLRDTVADGAPRIDSTMPYSGSASIRLEAGEAMRFKLTRPAAIRPLPEWGEFRFLRFVAKKPGGGALRLVIERADGEPDVTLLAGLPASDDPQVRIVLPSPVPDAWTGITRDLFADLGECRIVAVRLESADDKPALFDFVYLGRSPSDLDRQPPMPTTSIDPAAVEQTAINLSPQLVPSLAWLTFADGRRAMGIPIDGTQVVTVGHAAALPNQPATIHFADGRSFAATTLGIWRDADLALVRIEQPDAISARPVNAAQDPSPRDPAFVYRETSVDDVPSRVLHPANVRRTLPMSIWLDESHSGWLPGEPIFDAAGQVLALTSRSSPMGGVYASRLNGLAAVMPRLAAAEVWGRWPRGSEPRHGVSVSRTRSGQVVIHSVEPNSPAAAAGLQTNDVLVRVHGKSVALPGDLPDAISELNAGQAVVVEFLRADAPGSATLTLGARR